jgi:CO dehydrogenase/acetyl-CoA synthase beta subunit
MAEDSDQNTVPELMRFFSTPEHPVTSREFRLFWESLTEEEKEEFRQAKLHSD